MTTVSTKTDGNSPLFLIWITLGLLFSGLVFDPASRGMFLPIRQFLLSIWILVGTVGGLLFYSKGLKLSWSSWAFLISGSLLAGFSFLSTTWAFSSDEALIASNRTLIQLGMVTFFLLFSNQLKTNLHQIVKVLAAWLIVLSLLGIFQYFEWTTFPMESSSQPIGLSGNRNLFGSMLVLLLPWSVYLFLTGSPSWSKIGILAFGLGIIALMLSQTRSAWIAFGASFAVIQLLLWSSKSKHSDLIRKRWKVINLTLSGTAILFVLLLFVSEKGANLRADLGNRLISLVQVPSAEDDAVNEAERNILDRFHLWYNTADMAMDNSMTGVGAGNWKIEFPKYGGSSAPRFEEKDKLRVRPHNEYLNVFSELGIIGLTLFLVLFELVFGSLIRSFAKDKGSTNLLTSITLIAIALGITIDFVFSFALERMGHSYLLAFNIALALQLGSTQFSKTPMRKWLGAGLCVLALLTTVMSYHYWQANKSYHELLRAELREQWGKAITVSQDISEMPLSSLDPVGDPLYWHMANAYKQSGQLDKALVSIDQAMEQHPNSHRVWNTKAAILIQQNQFEEAIPALRTALELAPDYDPALSNLGYALYRTDQFEEAITTILSLDLKKHARLIPIIWDAGQRSESKWLESSLFYKAGINAFKSSNPLPQNQWPEELRLIRDTFDSDEDFVVAYFETLQHYVLLKNWQKKRAPEEVIAVQNRLDQTIQTVKELESFKEISDAIILNHHLKTLAKLEETGTEGDVDLKDLLFLLF